MADNRETTRHTVKYSAEFDELLMEAYPAAQSPTRALVMAAQAGVDLKLNPERVCPEEIVRAIVRDELERDHDGG